MRNQALITILLGLCLFALSACGGQLYKVAPLPADAAPAISSNATANLGAGAVALDGDAALERFEANLPLAGVIAVDLLLSNKATEAINASALKFEMRNSSGAKLKPLTPKKALGRVMKYYGNSFYALAARDKTRGDYEAVSLQLAGDIAPGQERRGILFFQTDRDTASVDGLTLSISGAAAPITLSVNSR